MLSFAALAVRNFRIHIGTQLIASCSLWMARLAQDWLILQLTGSPGAVGVAVALQFAPMVLFGIAGGVLADRFPRRPLLILTQGANALVAATLATLAFTGLLQPWQLFTAAGVVGLVTAVQNPARQVFVHDLVGPDRLVNAVSLNSSAYQLGAAAGPAVAGLILQTAGAGGLFSVGVAANSAVVLGLVVMRGAEFHAVPAGPPSDRQARDGLQYVLHHDRIRWVLVVTLFVGLLATNVPILLAAFVEQTYGGGAGRLGLFSALVAVGSLGGALLATGRRLVRLHHLVAAAAGCGLCHVAAAVVPGVVTFSVLLVVVGLANLTVLTLSNALVQSSSDPAFRGRAMALYVMVMFGSQAIGGLVLGAGAEFLGAGPTMAVAGVLLSLAAVVIALVLLRSRALEIALSFPRRRFVPRIRVTDRRSTEQPN